MPKSFIGICSLCTTIATACIEPTHWERVKLTRTSIKTTIEKCITNCTDFPQHVSCCDAVSFSIEEDAENKKEINTFIVSRWRSSSAPFSMRSRVFLLVSFFSLSCLHNDACSNTFFCWFFFQIMHITGVQLHNSQHLAWPWDELQRCVHISSTQYRAYKQIRYAISIRLVAYVY